MEIPFKQGDWALLYTDGIPETTTPADEQFGVERFKQFLQVHNKSGANDFVDGFLEKLNLWADAASGREPEDDITLVAIQFNNL